MFIYENHMGGFYTSEEEFDYDQLYCEECGDSDSLLGSADIREEAWGVIKGYVDIHESGGYTFDYAEEFLNENFGGTMCEDEKKVLTYSEDERVEEIKSGARKLLCDCNIIKHAFSDPRNKERIIKYCVDSKTGGEFASIWFDGKRMFASVDTDTAVFEFTRRLPISIIARMDIGTLMNYMKANSAEIGKEFSSEKAAYAIRDRFNGKNISEKERKFVDEITAAAYGCCSMSEWNNAICKYTDAYLDFIDSGKKGTVPEEEEPVNIEDLDEDIFRWIFTCGTRYTNAFWELIVVLREIAKI